MNDDSRTCSATGTNMESLCEQESINSATAITGSQSATKLSRVGTKLGKGLEAHSPFGSHGFCRDIRCLELQTKALRKVRGSEVWGLEGRDALGGVTRSDSRCEYDKNERVHRLMGLSNSI